jgi:hypothetical protein
MSAIGNARLLRVITMVQITVLRLERVSWTSGLH